MKEKFGESTDLDSKLLQRKAGFADELIKSFDASIGSEDLVNALFTSMGNSIRNEVRKRFLEDFGLAGLAEGTVSLLLKHLDVTGVGKMGLENIVTSRLLLDVPSVKSLIRANGSNSIKRGAKYEPVSIDRDVMHKFQVFVRAEVHWLLESKEKKQEYEDGMLAHLRQISLQSGRSTMMKFLKTTITLCYVDRLPGLLKVLYDQFGLEHPAQVEMAYSPTTSCSKELSDDGQESRLCAIRSSEGKAHTEVTVEPCSEGVSEARKELRATPENMLGPIAVVSSEKTKLNHKKKKKQKRVRREDVDTERCQPSVKEDSPTALEKVQGELDYSSHPNENEIDPLDTELKDKEAKLHEVLTSEVSLVESKGKEMSVLISAVDEVEDEKHAKQKQVADIDGQMMELQMRKDQLVKDIEDGDQKLEKILKKKTKLENFIAEKVNENKRAKRQLEKEIEDIKARQERQKSEEMARNKIEKLQPENLRLLEYIDGKIEAKEKELECPVCFEVASVPIFCCDDQHIICSDCRPKVMYLDLETLLLCQQSFSGVNLS